MVKLCLNYDGINVKYLTDSILYGIDFLRKVTEPFSQNISRQLVPLNYLKWVLQNYDRPLMLLMEKEKHMWSENKNCFLNKLPSELMLEYLYKFMHANRNTPHFALTWINSVAHDKFEGPLTADKHFYRFFLAMF